MVSDDFKHVESRACPMSTCAAPPASASCFNSPRRSTCRRPRHPVGAGRVPDLLGLQRRGRLAGGGHSFHPGWSDSTTPSRPCSSSSGSMPTEFGARPPFLSSPSAAPSPAPCCSGRTCSWHRWRCSSECCLPRTCGRSTPRATPQARTAALLGERMPAGVMTILVAYTLRHTNLTDPRFTRTSAGADPCSRAASPTVPRTPGTRAARRSPHPSRRAATRWLPRPARIR